MILTLLLACPSDTTTTTSDTATAAVTDSVPDSSTPTDTASPPAYTGLSSEGARTCVLTPTSTLACFDVTDAAWSRSQDTPAGLFSHVSAGGCGVQGDDVTCWDPDQHGTSIVPDSDLVTVERGDALACGHDDIGALDCWGETRVLTGLFYEQRVEASLMVSGKSVCGLLPAGVPLCDGALAGTTPELSDLVQVDVGGAACGLGADGAVTCWGPGTPFTVPDGTGFVDVAVGESHVCVLDDAGVVSCSGNGALAQVPAELPVMVDLDAGTTQTCGLSVAGALVCWFEGADGVEVVTEMP